ncbi:MAG: type III secretion system chaperone [Hydrogenophaga sp.]
MNDVHSLDDPETLDALIAAAIDQSDQLLGFVREDGTPAWRLLAADDHWIDVAVIDSGLLTISTGIGMSGPAQGSHRLHELMLQYLGFHADAAFSIDATGEHRLQQTLPVTALAQERLGECLERFANRAHAWRSLMQSPNAAGASTIEGLAGISQGLRA